MNCQQYTKNVGSEFVGLQRIKEFDHIKKEKPIVSRYRVKTGINFCNVWPQDKQALLANADLHGNFALIKQEGGLILLYSVATELLHKRIVRDGDHSERPNYIERNEFVGCLGKVENMDTVYSVVNKLDPSQPLTEQLERMIIDAHMADSEDGTMQNKSKTKGRSMLKVSSKGDKYRVKVVDDQNRTICQRIVSVRSEVLREYMNMDHQDTLTDDEYTFIYAHAQAGVYEEAKELVEYLNILIDTSVTSRCKFDVYKGSAKVGSFWCRAMGEHREIAFSNDGHPVDALAISTYMVNLINIYGLGTLSVGKKGGFQDNNVWN